MTDAKPRPAKRRRWMSKARLQVLVDAGLSYDEIASVMLRVEGWEPHKTSVMRHLADIGIESGRRVSHAELIPWRRQILPEHRQDRMRYMLGAESRKRQGLELKESDTILIDLLYDLLFGRGNFLVVGYHPAVGWFLADRKETDTDIIRQPVATLNHNVTHKVC